MRSVFQLVGFQTYFPDGLEKGIASSVIAEQCLAWYGLRGLVPYSLATEPILLVVWYTSLSGGNSCPSTIRGLQIC
jgi:hypothetical protein